MTVNYSQTKVGRGSPGLFREGLLPGNNIFLLCMALPFILWLTSQMALGQTLTVMDPEQMAVVMDTLEEKDLGQVLSGLMQYGVETMAIMPEAGDSIDPEQAGFLEMETARESAVLFYWPIDPEQAQEMVND